MIEGELEYEQQQPVIERRGISLSMSHREKIEDIPVGGSGIVRENSTLSITGRVVSLSGVIYRESIGRGME